MTLRASAIVILSLLAQSSASAAGPQLAWSVKLAPSVRQVEVILDTRSMASNAIVEKATFTASFFGANNKHIGSTDYSLIDSKLPVIESGHVYLRRLDQRFFGVARVLATNLSVVSTIDGGKADGHTTHDTSVVAPTPIAPGSADKIVDPVQASHGVIVSAPLALPISRCQTYANTAVLQNARNVQRQCSFTGRRWSEAYSHHYRWCLSQTNETTASETNARSRGLKQCTSAHMMLHVPTAHR